MSLRSLRTGTPKIIVAMSGGIDSSVAAALLKRAGFDIVGVFMKFWLARRSFGEGGAGYNRCCSSEAEERAREVANILGIPFYVLNFKKEFKKRVVDYFLKEYRAGRTPNPCVVCNKEIKFGLLLEKALALEADFIATGHYARVSPLEKHNNFPLRGKFCSTLGLAPRLRRDHGRSPSEKFSLEDTLTFKLLQAKDKEKDQSYFLWMLSQKQLKHVLFPVGDYTKKEVRALAKKFGLPTHNAPESMEICFVQTTIDDFLGDYLKQKSGKIIDSKGKMVGKHLGLAFYTIGQRKGIGLSDGPFWVLAKDLKKNLLIVTKDEKDLYKRELIFENANWLSGKAPIFPLKVKAKIRYRSKLTSATIYKNNKAVFNQSQRAITPGQSVIFYRGQELLGGGIIS